MLTIKLMFIIIVVIVLFAQTFKFIKKKLNKPLIPFGLLIIFLLVLNGCVDNTSSIHHCDKLGLQYTGKILGCDVECINVSTGEKFLFDGKCRFLDRGG